MSAGPKLIRNACNPLLFRGRELSITGKDMLNNTSKKSKRPRSLVIMKASTFSSSQNRESGGIFKEPIKDYMDQVFNE